MLDIFLSAPFAHPDILDVLFADDTAPVSLRRATLPDHVLVEDRSGMALSLLRREGGLTEGVIVTAEAAAAARVTFVMAAFGAETAEVPVDGADGPAVVLAHVREKAPSGPSRIAEPRSWTGERQMLLHEIVREIAGHIGERRPGEMPALLHGICFRALARVRGRTTDLPAVLRRSPRQGDVEVLGLQSGYAKYFGVEEHVVSHRRFDGGASGALERAVMVSGDGVTVVPYDPVQGTVLLIEQFRPGPHARRDTNPWLLEPIAGRCDKLEPLEDSVRREAREEAGLELGRLVRLPGYYSTPGVCAEFLTPFIAEADLSRAGGVHGLAEEGEDIRSIVVPLEVAMEAVASGEINVGPLILSLLWLDANRSQLARDWGASSAA